MDSSSGAASLSVLLEASESRVVFNEWELDPLSLLLRGFVWFFDLDLPEDRVVLGEPVKLILLPDLVSFWRDFFWAQPQIFLFCKQETFNLGIFIFAHLSQ